MASGFIAFLAAATMSATAPQALRFDLACVGTEPVAVSPGTGKRQSFRERLRVDLVQKRFCSDACKIVRPIKSISANELVLLNEVAGRHRNLVTLSRPADGGPETFRSEYPGQNVARQGTCTRTAFSGIPASAFFLPEF